MIQRCRNLVGEPDSTNTFLSTVSYITDEINDGLRHTAVKLGAILTYHDIDVTAGDGIYTLKVDFLAMKSVRYVDATKQWVLRELDLKAFEEYDDGDIDDQGRPDVYKVEIGAVDVVTAYPADLWLKPIPDTSSTASVPKLRVYYYQLPTDLTSGAQISEVPLYAQKAACYYASANLAMMMEDQVKHDRLYGKFENEVNEILEIIGSKGKDSPMLMRDEMGYTR